MHTTYDPEADAAYIYIATTIAPGGVARTVANVIEHVNIDLDAQGRILGVEVLNARARLLPETLSAAVPPGSGRTA